MKNNFKTLILGIGLICSFLGFVYVTQASFSSGSIILGLYYNHGTISQSEDEGEFNITTDSFVPPTPKSYPFYTAELYDSNGNLLIQSQVDQMNINGLLPELDPLNESGEGYVRIIVPFDQAVAKIVFKNEKGQPAGQVDIAPTDFCNANGVCESQLNENSDVCSVDCHPAINTPTQSRSTWQAILPLIIWFGLAIVIGVGWFIIRSRSSINIS